MIQQIIRTIREQNPTKIVLCVLDGLGGLPVNGKTELEAANTPNLNKLAQRGALGLHIPVAPGITPGSGAAHLALFGYDPLEHAIGRGVLEALGLGIELSPKDVAIRGNFATVEYSGAQPIVKDRRGGRIPTEENKRIVEKIRDKVFNIGEVSVGMTSGIEHRFVLILTFPEALADGADDILDTDPQHEGKSPLPAIAQTQQAGLVADVIDKFVSAAAEVIKDEPVANYILLRGASMYPNLPTFRDVYGVEPAAIAAYPMYRGVSKLVGMEVLEVADISIKSEIETLCRHYEQHDFFYLHVKKTDSYGEDGNFEGKVKVIEEFDSFVPKILELNPDVLVVTGDHSTPALMKSHSWHPVPLLLNSRYARGANVSEFSEKDCLRGELGTFMAKDIMTLMLAHAGKLQKFGA